MVLCRMQPNHRGRNRVAIRPLESRRHRRMTRQDAERIAQELQDHIGPLSGESARKAIAEALMDAYEQGREDEAEYRHDDF